MKTKSIRLSLLAVSIFTISSLFLSAQVTLDTEDDIVVSESSCTDLTYYMSTRYTRSAETNMYSKLQATDEITKGEVSRLQDFLKEEGFLSKTQVVTGRFGPATQSALSKFQKSNGLSPTGATGPKTLAKIKEVSGCDDDEDDVVPVKVIKDTPRKEIRFCTMEARLCADGSTMPREEDCTWRADKCPLPKKDKDIQRCTMEARLCADGSTMPREDDCTWRADKCPLPNRSQLENIKTGVQSDKVQVSESVSGSSAVKPATMTKPAEIKSFDSQVIGTLPKGSCYFDEQLYKSRGFKTTLTTSTSRPWLEANNAFYANGKFYLLPKPGIMWNLWNVNDGQISQVMLTCSEGVIRENVVSAVDGQPIALASPAAQGTVLGDSAVRFTFNNDLQIGKDYPKDIEALQAILAEEGLYTGEISGGYYAETFKAVKLFQQKNGIKPSGYVGAITRDLLNSLYGY
jgi:peptidoglycan hydrolase-like protein with peptidoglycan-binding domain